MLDAHGKFCVSAGKESVTASLSCCGFLDPVDTNHAVGGSAGLNRMLEAILLTSEHDFLFFQ